jgi:hypothetical protein
MDLLDHLAALDRPRRHEAACSPICEWIGEPVPPVSIGDVVTLCTASGRHWRVIAVYDDDMVALTPARRDRWLDELTAHRNHVELVPTEPHTLIGPRRIRLDVQPHGMRAVQCACGALPRDEAAHARHVARRAATGCDCAESCTHTPKDTP